MKNVRLLLSFTLISFVLTLNADAHLEINFSNYISTVNKITSNGVAEISINTPSLEKSLINQSEIVIRNVPLATGKKTDFVMQRVRNIADYKTKVLIAGPNGDINSTIPKIITFGGNLGDNSSARAFLFLSGDFMILYVDFPDGSSSVITPEISIPGRFIISSNNSFTDKLKSYNCIFNDKKIETNAPKFGSDKILSDSLLEAEIAVETDTEYFINTGSDTTKAKNYLLALLSLVSYNYEKETNISFYLKWLKIWTDNPRDPYNVKGDAYALPAKVVDYWKQNYANVERDFFHVITSIGYGGGGFGYYDALCGKNGDYGFSVSSVQASANLPTYAFTYDVYILSHEIGHNFNAPHSHSCYWGAPLDTCMVDEGISGKCLDSTQQPKPNPGSIMSYCGGINNANGFGWQVRMTFLPPVIKLIRATAEAAGCITAPHKPTISLLKPHGQETFNAGTRTYISWVSSGVVNISLEYSDDNGSNWYKIASGLPSGPDSLLYELPDLCSSKMLIRAFSEEDTAIECRTALNFTVFKEDSTGLVAYYPFRGNSHDEQICNFYDAMENGAKLTADRSGNENNAYDFDGKSYLWVPSFNGSFSELSYSFWFNLDSASGKQNFLGTNYQEGWVFESYFWGAIGASYYLDGAGVPTQLWGGFPQLHKWEHLAFTFDGTTAKIFLNGNKTGEQSDGKAHKLNQFSATPLYIGSRKNNDYLGGKIDDIRIYKRALSEQEVAMLYTENTPYDVSAEQGTGCLVQVMPNPATDGIKFIFPDIACGESRLKIFNPIGMIIYNREIKTGENNLDIDISRLVPGIYLYEFSNCIGSSVGKISVIR